MNNGREHKHLPLGSAHRKRETVAVALSCIVAIIYSSATILFNTHCNPTFHSTNNYPSESSDRFVHVTLSPWKTNCFDSLVCSLDVWTAVRQFWTSGSPALVVINRSMFTVTMIERQWTMEGPMETDKDDMETTQNVSSQGHIFKYKHRQWNDSANASMVNLNQCWQIFLVLGSKKELSDAVILSLSISTLLLPTLVVHDKKPIHIKETTSKITSSLRDHVAAAAPGLDTIPWHSCWENKTHKCSTMQSVCDQQTIQRTHVQTQVPIKTTTSKAGKIDFTQSCTTTQGTCLLTPRSKTIHDNTHKTSNSNSDLTAHVSLVTCFPSWLQRFPITKPWHTLCRSTVLWILFFLGTFCHEVQRNATGHRQLTHYSPAQRHNWTHKPTSL